MKDEVYRENQQRSPTSRSVKKSLSVFDDMLERSVPFYAEMQRMIAEMASDFATPGSQCLRPGLLDRHDHA